MKYRRLYTKRQNELSLKVDNLAKKRNISQLLKRELVFYEILDKLDNITEEIEKDRFI